jgi:hypothetical protein
MKRVFSIMVNGRQKKWSFNFDGEEQYWHDWIDDGLEVYMVENSCPVWVHDIGLLPVWFFFQNIFRK